VSLIRVIAIANPKDSLDDARLSVPGTRKALPTAIRQEGPAMKRSAVIWLVIGMIIAGSGTYFLMSGRGGSVQASLQDAMANLKSMTAKADAANAQIADLQKVIEERDKTLLGYTAYKNFLTAGKKQIAGQTQLLTATVARDEGYIKYLTTTVMGVKSNGAVKISYKAEYNFGFDLPPDQYEVRAVPNGIEVVVGRPKLIGTPAVSNLKHEILSVGFLTDEKLAVIELQQDAAKRTKQQGLDMAKQPAIAALCEKRLIEFLRDFLTKQPGVQVVPQIAVVYK
jgi:hypothetical protein